MPECKIGIASQYKDVIVHFYSGPLEIIHEEDLLEEDELRTRSESSLLRSCRGRGEYHGGRKRQRETPSSQLEAPSCGCGGGKFSRGARVSGAGHGCLNVPLHKECPKHGSINSHLCPKQNKISSHKPEKVISDRHSKYGKSAPNKHTRGCNEHPLSDRSRCTKPERYKETSRKSVKLDNNKNDRSKPAMSQTTDMRIQEKRHDFTSSPVKPSRSAANGKDRNRRHRRERRYTKMLLLDDLFQVDNRLLEKLAKCEGTGFSPERRPSPRKSPRKTRRGRGQQNNLRHDRKSDLLDSDITDVQNAILELQDECKACLKHLSSQFGTDSRSRKQSEILEEQSSPRWPLKLFSSGKRLNKKTTKYIDTRGNADKSNTANDKCNNNNKSHLSLNELMKNTASRTESEQCEQGSKDILSPTDTKQCRVNTDRGNNYYKPDKKSALTTERQDTPRHHSFSRTAQSGKETNNSDSSNIVMTSIRYK